MVWKKRRHHLNRKTALRAFKNLSNGMVSDDTNLYTNSVDKFVDKLWVIGIFAFGTTQAFRCLKNSQIKYNKIN
ncbi:hypothetical protein HMPREF2936_04265 [Neisseria sp. HMSC064F04]|nr:hypothetical protein HMPREF2936_04265 [Neisseria sp. HMSC064F04]